MNTKQFVARVRSSMFDMRKTTLLRLEEIVELRLKGHSFEEIADYFGLAKSRIFKLEKDYMNQALTTQEGLEYQDLISSAKKSLTSIGRRR